MSAKKNATDCQGSLRAFAGLIGPTTAGVCAEADPNRFAIGVGHRGVALENAPAAFIVTGSFP